MLQIWNWLIWVPFSLGVLMALLSLGAGKKRKAKGRACAQVSKAKISTPKASSAKTRAAKTAPKAPLPPFFGWQNGLLGFSACALALKQTAISPFWGALFGAACAALFSLALSRIFARLTPEESTSVTTETELVGRVGEVSANVDLQKGAVYVRDQFGTLHQITARSQAPIARGKSVLILEKSGDVFRVEEF